MASFERELGVAEALAREAGALALRYFGTELTVHSKVGNEPVTRADREASDLIVRGLGAAFPVDVIISEEAADDRRRLEPDRRVWYVDPIDGTRDFIRGRQGFAVMIGLAVGGVPRLGVVYQPPTDRLFRAAAGEGSWLVAAGAPPRRLRCAPTTDLGALRLVASRSHRTAEIDAVKSALGIDDEMNVGSVGLKLGLIAQGERDLYVNPSSKSSAWDTCAPEVLLVEAGGRITDLDGSPLRYDAPALKNERGLLASNGIVHDQLVEKLMPLFRRRT
jgi:3'(2'), 5'-bisphosphate nucleotidase